MTQFDPSPTERDLRRALADRAAQVHPSNRLDAILHEATTPPASPMRNRWLTGLAVAATAAIVGGAVWVARPGTEPTLPGGPATQSPTPSPTQPSLSPTPTLTTPTKPEPSPSDTAVGGGPTSMTGALAVYGVGSNGGEPDRSCQVREFWTSGLGRATDAQRVEAAAGESLRRTAAWADVRVSNAAVTNSRISVELSGAGAASTDNRAARLAVAALVSTAQAAVGRGDLPVRITTPGSGPLLGQVATNADFTRASAPPDSLCDIWIDHPAPSVALSASSPVVVRGQAVAWEANVEWELRSGTDVVREGFTNASAGAPARGTFTIDLGALPAGTWTVRAFTTSPKDGIQALAEREVTFSVK